MSAEQYLAWERVQLERHEFFRGEVFEMAGGEPRHSALSAAVIGELGIALRGSDGRVLSGNQRIAAQKEFDAFETEFTRRASDWARSGNPVFGASSATLSRPRRARGA